MRALLWEVLADGGSKRIAAGRKTRVRRDRRMAPVLVTLVARRSAQHWSFRGLSGLYAVAKRELPTVERVVRTGMLCISILCTAPAGCGSDPPPRDLGIASSSASGGGATNVG